MPVCQKLGMVLENKVVQKFKLEKKVFYKKWSPKLIFLSVFFFFFFWENSVDFWHRKLTLIEQFRHFLTHWCSPYSQNTMVSFEYLSILFFGQKCCFLGPTIFKIPKPSWHYYAYICRWSLDSQDKKNILLQIREARICFV